VLYSVVPGWRLPRRDAAPYNLYSQTLNPKP